MTGLPNWYFDEFKMAGVDFADPAQVAAFDRKQRSSTPEAEQALVSRLGISSGQTVIDLGSGTGTFAWMIEGMLHQAKFRILEANYLSPVLAEYLCERVR